MHQVLADPNLAPSEKTPSRLLDESQLMIGAGLAMTGWAAFVALHHILANPQTHARILDELFTVMPPGQKRHDCTDLCWSRLEALPYFQA